MFSHLVSYPRILVTGPQRSGTRICAKMIAHDTGHRYVDEAEFHADSLNSFFAIWRSETRTVVQAPALARYAHRLVGPEDLLVLMYRPIEEIVASQERIGWRWAWPELVRFGVDGDSSPGSPEPARRKYWWWEQYQTIRVTNQLEVHYHDLAGHPLWLPAEQRCNFAEWQTEA